MKELEKMASELRHSVESLWERLEIPTQEQQKVLDMVESFRPRDIQVVSNVVLWSVLWLSSLP